MADQGNKTTGTIKAKVVRIAYLDPLTEVAPETLDEIIASLNLEGDPRCGELRRKLDHAARSYLFWKEVLADGVSPRKAKAGLARLASVFGEAVELIDSMSLQHRGALQVMLDSADPARGQSLLVFRQTLERLRKAAGDFSERYDPPGGRPRNVVLEQTVGALMLLLERHTGARAEVSLKKDGAYRPRLTSPEAQAIGKLLRAVDSRLTTTMIANKLHEIGKVHHGRSLAEYRWFLLGAEPGIRIRPFGREH